MNTLLIALGGIRVGKILPRELATQGLLEGIAKEAGVEALGGVWVFPTMPRPIEPRRRKDCVIMVDGCHASLSATAENVGAGMPTTEQLDEMDDLAWIEDIRRMAAEAAIDEEEEIQFQVWEHFQELKQEAQRREEEASAFRKNVASLVKGLRKGPRREIVEISKVMVGFAEENFELRRRLEALESKAAVAEKPAAKPGRKTQKK